MRSLLQRHDLRLVDEVHQEVDRVTQELRRYSPRRPRP